MVHIQLVLMELAESSSLRETSQSWINSASFENTCRLLFGIFFVFFKEKKRGKRELVCLTEPGTMTGSGSGKHEVGDIVFGM